MLYMVKFPLREKYLYLEFFWSVFFWIRTEYGYLSLHIAGKYIPEKHRIQTLSTQCVLLKKCLNPFSTNVPPIYLLKTLENWRFSDVFMGYRNATLLENGLISKLWLHWRQLLCDNFYCSKYTFTSLTVKLAFCC